MVEGFRENLATNGLGFRNCRFLFLAKGGDHVPMRNLAILFIASFVSLICYGEAGRNRYANILSESIDKVAAFYVEPVTSRQLFESGMKGMLNDLDPYSGYISPQQLSEFQVDIQQEFGGIGIEVGMQDDRLTVLSPVPGTPAYKAGLLAGDTILSIEGQDTTGFSLQDAVELMRGPRGTPVKLTVLHRGDEEPVEYSIIRDKIQIESIRGDHRSDDSEWVFQLTDDPRIGYVRLTSFGDHTAEDLAQRLGELKGNVDGLIIDLRGNAGGLLTAAIEICDMFIPKGEMIVSTRGRDPKMQREFLATKDPIVDPKLPIVILVDPLSASASEIFAACMQDYGRAIIVGERTWGKGTVQNVIEIEGGRSAIRLTTQTYWRPSGRNIHRHSDVTEEDEWGVKPLPENEVRLTPEQREAFYKYRRDRDISPSLDDEGVKDKLELQDADGDDTDGDNTDGDNVQIELDETVDLQLQRAIEVLKQEMPPRVTTAIGTNSALPKAA